MGQNKPALYAAGVTCLGFVCFALSATAIGLPTWGYYGSVSSYYDQNTGYFGPWRACKRLQYSREKCGDDIGFTPSKAVYVTGVLGVVACLCLGVFSVLSVIQIASISSKDTVVIKYRALVVLKLVLAIVAVVTALLAVIVFAFVSDDTRGGFRVTNGVAFYLELLAVVLTIFLVVLAIYDVLQTRRPGGDPTMPVDINAPATTYNNPGFREGGRNGGVSMTDASGKPYGSSVNGSLQSMNTTVTSVTNGSSSIGSVTRSPLRSSLKKPRQPRSTTDGSMSSQTTAGGLGIQNPGFSGGNASPTFQRSNSVKRVRIQTQSTEV